MVYHTDNHDDAEMGFWVSIFKTAISLSTPKSDSLKNRHVSASLIQNARWSICGRQYPSPLSDGRDGRGLSCLKVTSPHSEPRPSLIADTFPFHYPVIIEDIRSWQPL